MKRKINIGRYQFEGPFYFVLHLKPLSGVYAIICEEKGGEKIIDVGEADNLFMHVRANKNIPCWKENCKGFARMAAYYCDEADRKLMARQLRDQFLPPCPE